MSVVAQGHLEQPNNRTCTTIPGENGVSKRWEGGYMEFYRDQGVRAKCLCYGATCKTLFLNAIKSDLPGCSNTYLKNLIQFCGNTKHAPPHANTSPNLQFFLHLLITFTAKCLPHKMCSDITSVQNCQRSDMEGGGEMKFNFARSFTRTTPPPPPPHPTPAR